MTTRLSVSHIAWPPEEEQNALDFLKEKGVSSLELAPMRAFGSPLNADRLEVMEKAAFYQDQGFAVSSFQALLFGSEGLELFGSEIARENLKKFLIAVGRLAGWAGAGPLVFGSPKNRLKRDLSHEEAERIAIPFFRAVGDACAEAGSCLVIEANPPSYGADYCNTLEEAACLVAAVDSLGFGLHVDAGGMALCNDPFESTLRQAASLLRHVHASQPDLASFTVPDPIHVRLASVLHEIGYEGTIAIEMRSQPEGMEAVSTAIQTVRSIYSPMDAPGL